MKVAHIIDALGWGGAQKLLLIYTETARRRGLDTLVISIRTERNETDIPELLKGNGAEVIELKCEKLYDPRTIPTLMFLLRKKHVDIVHTHLSHAIILGGIAAKAMHIPTVATLHNPRISETGRLNLRKKLELFSLRNMAARVIAVGENVATAYRPILGNAVIDVISNSVSLGRGISLEQRTLIRTGLAGNPDRIIVLAVGSLRVVKGYFDMLSAFAQVNKQNPLVFLVIIGIGDLMESLVEYTKSLGMADHVRFLGARGDVTEILASVDVFVNSSYSEGLSIAMLEAMAAGLPVVATSVGDAGVLLATGGGLLVEARNPDSFAAALESLIIDLTKMRIVGQRARECVEKNYASDAWLDKLLTCYSLAQKNDAWLGFKL